MFKTGQLPQQRDIHMVVTMLTRSGIDVAFDPRNRLIVLFLENTQSEILRINARDWDHQPADEILKNVYDRLVEKDAPIIYGHRPDQLLA